jgi:hypothetical protein
VSVQVNFHYPLPGELHGHFGAEFVTLDIGDARGGQIVVFFDTAEAVAVWCDDVAGKARALMPAEVTT